VETTSATVVTPGAETTGPAAPTDPNPSSQAAKAFLVFSIHQTGNEEDDVEGGESAVQTIKAVD